jgi:hypothetical protein
MGWVLCFTSPFRRRMRVILSVGRRQARPPCPGASKGMGRGGAPLARSARRDKTTEADRPRGRGFDGRSALLSLGRRTTARGEGFARPTRKQRHELHQRRRRCQGARPAAAPARGGPPLRHHPRAGPPSALAAAKSCVVWSSAPRRGRRLWRPRVRLDGRISAVVLQQRSRQHYSPGRPWAPRTWCDEAVTSR